MIYSRKHRYLFIHIPKTGGTSMALALEARAAKDDIMLGDTPKARNRRKRLDGIRARGRLWKHSTLSDLDGLISETDLEGVTIFTMVRNPWDRIVSYYHWLQAQTFDHQAVRLAKSLGFSEFLNHAHTTASLSQSPYRSYVSDAQGQDRCAFYLRLEHLATDLPQLEAMIDLKLSPFPHTNASAREAPYQQYYTLEDQHLVSRIAAEDINRFGYQFEPVSPP